MTTLRERIAKAIMEGYKELRPEDMDPDACWYAADHVIGVLTSELTGLGCSVRHHPRIISPGVLTFTEQNPEREPYSVSLNLG